MLDRTLHILDYFTPEEVIGFYERLYGELPEPAECEQCGTVFVLTSSGRRTGPNVKYCSRRCATRAAQAAYRQREQEAQEANVRIRSLDEQM